MDLCDKHVENYSLKVFLCEKVNNIKNIVTFLYEIIIETNDFNKNKIKGLLPSADTYNYEEIIKGLFSNIYHDTQNGLVRIPEPETYINVLNAETNLPEYVNQNKIVEELLKITSIAYNIQIEAFKNFEEKVKVKQKSLEKDDVTNIDIEIENTIKLYLKNIFPSYILSGEETFTDSFNKDESKIILMDPIDGTSYFIKKIAKFGTIIGIFRNGYNIGGVVLNTLGKEAYFADLKGFYTYKIDDNGEFKKIEENENTLKKRGKQKDKIKLFEGNELVEKEVEKNKIIYFHVNFKGDKKIKNEEMVIKFKEKLDNYNNENNTDYVVAFNSHSAYTGIEVARGISAGFITYGPGYHDFGSTLIYNIHMKQINNKGNPLVPTNHRGIPYNYLNSQKVNYGYSNYYKNIDTDGKNFIYCSPMISSNNNAIQNLALEFFKENKEYLELFDIKQNGNDYKKSN